MRINGERASICVEGSRPAIYYGKFFRLWMAEDWLTNHGWEKVVGGYRLAGKDMRVYPTRISVKTRTEHLTHLSKAPKRK